MKKIIYFILASLLTHFTYAQSEDVHALIRLGKSGGNHLIYVISEDGKHIPSVAGTEEVRKLLAQLQPGEEAFVTGQVVHDLQGKIETQNFQSYFVIKDLRPISLTKLALPYEKVEAPLVSLYQPNSYGTLSFPVSTEVASAITLTSSMLLMDNLANAGTDPSGRKDMKQGLLFTAGTMATLIFLYDQFKVGLK